MSLAACDSGPKPGARTAPAPSTAAASTTAAPSTGPAPSAKPSSIAAAPKASAGSAQLIEEKDYTGAILPADYDWSRGKKRWRPDEAAVAKVEACIGREIGKMKATPDYQAEKVPLIVKRLKEYKRQYLGYTDDKGVRKVWVNFFHDPEGRHADWKTELVTVRGGGHGYFNVTVDVAAGTCSELRINSPR